MMVEIAYGEFYDLPRQLILSLGTQLVFLVCHFDEQNQEYRDEYEVYVAQVGHPVEAGALREVWKRIQPVARHVGNVRLHRSHFDDTRRRLLDVVASGVMRVVANS